MTLPPPVDGEEVEYWIVSTVHPPDVCIERYKAVYTRFTKWCDHPFSSSWRKTGADFRDQWAIWYWSSEQCQWYPHGRADADASDPRIRTQLPWCMAFRTEKEAVEHAITVLSREQDRLREKVSACSDAIQKMMERRDAVVTPQTGTVPAAAVQ